MSDFLIESPHTQAECLQAIDGTLAKGEATLSKFQWGCESGNHTGWAFVRASSESKAREMVPSVVRKKARIVKVSRFTPNQIRAYHEK